MNTSPATRSFRPAAFIELLKSALAVKRGHKPAARPVSARRSIALETLEPRMLLSANLTYATLDTAPATFADIPAYAASLVSTNYTLAETRASLQDTRAWVATAPRGD